jgi:dolichyl-phosphate-mannose--protein O-mannosyl transferase
MSNSSLENNSNAKRVRYLFIALAVLFGGLVIPSFFGFNLFEDVEFLKNNHEAVTYIWLFVMAVLIFFFTPIGKGIVWSLNKLFSKKN